MTQPAWNLTLPLFDVEAALARLPATLRARVAWAQKPIEENLARLQTQPLTDDLVASAAQKMWPAIGSLQSALSKIVAENKDAWGAKVVDEIKREEVQLGTFVEDDDARDTLDWILGFLHSLFTVYMSSALQETMLPEAAIEELSKDESFQPYVRGLVTLMGAVAVARSDGDPQRARELLNVSFLEMNRFVATLRGQGVFITPFPNDGVDERRRRFLASADRVRRSFSASDWVVLRDARLRNIR